MKASYRGTLVFANAHCVEAALDEFEAIYGLPIMGELGVTETSITIDSADGPASTYEVGLAKMRALASPALAGEIHGSIAADRIATDIIRASGRPSSAGLPPEHHRWRALAAAECGDVEALRRALDAGAAVDTRYRFAQDSLLHRAAHGGSVECVALLCEAGAEIDARTVDDRTPLFDASTRGVAEYLIARGANLQHRRDRTTSLLAHACAYGHPEVARFVVARADTMFHADELDDLAASCAYEGLVDVLRVIATRAPAFALHLRDTAILDAALEAGRPEIVDFLLEYGARLPDDLLAKAIDGGNVELVELALRRPDALEACGLSAEYDDAMCRAASAGNVAIMEVLERHGVPVHPRTPGQTSPIHAAAGVFDDAKRRACLDWLLARGVDIDARTLGGTTPMGAIAFTQRLEAVVDLIERGAPADRLDPTGPFAAAVQRRLGSGKP